MADTIRLRTVVKPRDDVITRLVISLEAEKIVCLPSDTCYGLSCLATSRRATAKLRQIKGRSPSKPFILVSHNIQMVRNYVKVWDHDAQSIAKAFWPGPITIIVPFQQCKTCKIAHNSNTIAVRVPGSIVLREIIKGAGCPLWSTSANDPGGPCASSIESIPPHLKQHVDLTLDIGPLPQARPSTIIDLSKKTPVILREGPIEARDIAAKTDIRLMNTDVDRQADNFL